MNLIEAFRGFEEVSERLKLTANVRSLYYAILGQFNKGHYPAEIRIGNTYLSELSGIRSSHSLDSARARLVNAGLIEYQKGCVYRLKESESERKNNGNSTETAGKFSSSTVLSLAMVREREVDADLKNKKSARVSEEVLKEWYECESEQLSGANLYGIGELESRHGVELVKEAIRLASRSNQYPRLYLSWVKHELKKLVKAREKASAKVAVTDEFPGGD